MLLVAKETVLAPASSLLFLDKTVKTVLYQGLKIAASIGVQGIYKKQCGLVIEVLSSGLMCSLLLNTTFNGFLNG